MDMGPSRARTTRRGKRGEGLLASAAQDKSGSGWREPKEKSRIAGGGGRGKSDDSEHENPLLKLLAVEGPD